MRVLFLCVANSARSQMAEALARHLFGSDIEVASAGSIPKQLHPLVPEVLAEIGVSVQGQRSKAIADLPSKFLEQVDIVVTLCAEESCPLVSTSARKESWPFPDPALAGLSRDESLSLFRQVRTGLQDRLAGALQSWNQHYWERKWAAKDIRFHQSQTNSYLQNFYPVTPGTAFVPLCGKSLDLHWLREQCGAVVGVELSEMACREFFSESNLAFTTERTERHLVFRGDAITIWCGDLFEIPERAVAEVTSWYDRACLIAFPPTLRRRYAEKMAALFPAKLPPALIITLEYEQDLAEGPPYSVQKSELQDLFGEGSRLEQRLRVEHSADKRLPKFSSLPKLMEVVWQVR